MVKKDNKKTQVKTKKTFFLKEVILEMKKVRWPLKKEMISNSMATLVFIIFFALFFTLADLVIASIKVLVA